MLNLFADTDSFLDISSRHRLRASALSAVCKLCCLPPRVTKKVFRLDRNQGAGLPRDIIEPPEMRPLVGTKPARNVRLREGSPGWLAAIQGADSVTTSVTVTYVIDVSLMEAGGIEPPSCDP